MRKFVIFLILLFWPLSLYLANTPSDFLQYFFPAILIVPFLKLKNTNYKLLILILITVIEPKFAILPLLYSLFSLNLKHSVISLIPLFIFWKDFYGQSIFVPDYQAQQEVLKNITLYPTVFLARLFQNKLLVIISKFHGNFFALTDPNNYFFAFAPRQIIVTNQNLTKFPIFALPFLLIGLLNFKNIYKYKEVLVLSAALILNLSIIINFDRHDYILWIPISLLIFTGLQKFNNKFYNLIFIIFSLIQCLRILISY